MDIVSSYPPPIYVNHEIIHNSYVVKMFERKWVIFESNLDAIPMGWLIVISAHGTGPSYFQELRKRGLRWIDATCPLVEKVHIEARNYINKGYHILYIWKKWHQEALWVIDEGSLHFTLIEKKEDLHQVDQQLPLALLTQTTLSVDDTEVLIETAKNMFPQIVLPKTSDICYATTNRQNALKSLAEHCEVIIVVGSKNSSNSNKLKNLAESLGNTAYLVDDARELESSWFLEGKSVWVTAWASWPEELVEGVLEKLKEFSWIFDSEIKTTEERMEFPYTLRIES